MKSLLSPDGLNQTKKLIQRYGLIIDAFSEGMGECHDGEYVLHADHLAAMAAKDAETKDALREVAQLMSMVVRAEQEAAGLRDAAAHCWLSGIPPKHYGEEWFIAETIHGDRVVLKALPEEYTYDYKTADDTYFMAKNVSRWMQFPDSEYVPAARAGGE